ncbi:hypothetical protein J4H86_22860 [Spiractinospora alimapuensis]|uniref:CorA family divalent cation transporter n=1 Tax=Spiractinospora alimapuensis TaxID=2820884 RepID=UPI001F413E36|nr:CorA family divalent cation transporter [Spiractinospora alimapuensis]QVQ51596.1 hypothetical protein J4H86_22860 [Spiractinospora alimapuensis]
MGGTLKYWQCSRQGVVEVADADAPRPDGTWLWVQADHPTAEELHAIADRLGLHPGAVNEGVQPHARTIQQIHGDQVLLAMKTVRYTSGPSVSTSRVVLIVGGSVLLSACFDDQDPVTPAINRLVGDDEPREHGVWDGVYSVVHEVVDGYTSTSDAVAADIVRIEQEVFSGRRVMVLEPIYGLMREVLEFRDAVDPMVSIVTDMATRQATSRRFRDAQHKVKQTRQSVASSEQLLTLILDVHSGQINLWQNQDMRQISAWAALIAIPTVITGVYGMNFHWMPELRWSWGYPGVMVLMVVVCVVLFLNFRRRGWL